MARVYSATGTALAAAAEETAMPRAQQASGTWPRTLPAVCTTARSSGADSSTAASRGGQPHPVTSSSVPASTARAPGVVRSSSTGGPVRSQTSARAASDSASRTAAAASGDMARAARGRRPGGDWVMGATQPSGTVNGQASGRGTAPGRFRGPGGRGAAVSRRTPGPPRGTQVVVDGVSLRGPGRTGRVRAGPLDPHAGPPAVDGQVRQSGVVGGEGAGGAVRQPGQGAPGQDMRAVRGGGGGAAGEDQQQDVEGGGAGRQAGPGARGQERRAGRGGEGAAAVEDQQQDVEFGLAVGVDPAAGRDADDVGVELAAGLREPPQGPAGGVVECGQGGRVAQDPRERVLVAGRHGGLTAVCRHQVSPVPWVLWRGCRAARDRQLKYEPSM